MEIADSKHLTASGICCGKSGVAARIKARQPNTPAVHFYSSFLSFTKGLTSSCEVLTDTMSTAGEIHALVMFSPKRENILETILKPVEGKLDDERDTNQFSLWIKCVLSVRQYAPPVFKRC